MKKTFLKIGNKMVGAEAPIFIVAEAGVNHNGDVGLAKKLVEVAREAGADAIKFQTFTAEELVTRGAPQAIYQEKNTGKKETQYELLKRLELGQEAHHEIKNYCREKGIIFLSTPFSEIDADFLETLDVPAYKISSADIDNIPLLKHIAKKGKPMIVSTGTANMREVKDAIKAIRESGNRKISVLHCTSNYPPSYESLNLNVLETFRAELSPMGIVVGYSDNGSLGHIAEVAAVALGASIIEKHFTLDKNMEGPDHKASLNPEELKLMVQAIRDTEKILGSYEKKCTAEEEPIKLVARKSLVARRDIKKSEKFSKENLVIKRPGTGLPPKYYFKLLGKIAKRNIGADTLIQKNDY